MRLAQRLSLAISLGICIVLGLNAWLRVEQERQSYRADVMRDHAAISRGLASAVEFVWGREGEAVAVEVVEQLNRRESHVTIRWVWKRAADAGAEYAPRHPELVPAKGQRAWSGVVGEADNAPYVLTYTPVLVPDGRPGAIEMFESLTEQEAAVRQASLGRAALTTVLLLLLCSSLTFAFGYLFVARPLRLLVAKAERIGEGDLTTPLVVAENSEIHNLAEAMNTMCERLAEARERAARETDARLRTLEQLRHADRLRTVGELASGIAHQIGTPLNVVRVRGAMIAGGDVPEARMRELGKVIVEHVDRISDTIRNLLGFARREQPRLTTTDLVRTLRQTVDLVDPLAHERRVGLRLHTPSEPVLLDVDAVQIHQALTNILVNAIHASPPKGEVEVTLGEDASGFVIAVHDHGEGIPAEQLAHIFEPFFTTKRAGEGTGLGLSVADGIVREHDGFIDVESREGEGATFRVHLPRKAALRGP